MVDDTAAALHQLRIDRTVVFGWSDGGVIALGLALEYPELVDKVAIAGAGYAPDAEPPGFRERMRGLAPDSERFREFREQYEKVAPDPAEWPRLVEKVKAMHLSFAGWDEKRLRELAAPLMVMLGDRDLTTLEHAIALYRLVPDGRLAVLPGSDHGAPVAHPDWVAAMLLDFFGR
jgi:pimeloyl-ACP methyl ester carboxylesterase